MKLLLSVGDRLLEPHRVNGDSAALPAAPSWLLDLLRPQRDLPVMGSLVPVAPSRATAYGRAALRRELERLALAEVGTRNDSLSRAAFALGQLVAVGALDEEETVTALTDAGQQLGLSSRECERTVVSGMNAGMERSRALCIGQ